VFNDAVLHWFTESIRTSLRRGLLEFVAIAVIVAGLCLLDPKLQAVPLAAVYIGLMGAPVIWVIYRVLRFAFRRRTVTARW